MRHRVFGRQLGRSGDKRKALFRNLIGELIIRGKIITTVAKAKAIKPLIDKLVTKAKKGTLAGRRKIFGQLPKEAAVALVNTIVPQLKARTSGFSRIIRTAPRSGDNAQMVVLAWTDEIVKSEKLKVQSEEKKKETKENKGTTEMKRKKKTVKKRKVTKKT